MFLDNCKAKNLRPTTIEHYKQGYKSIVRFFTGYIKDRYVFFSRSMKIKEMDIIVQNQIYYFILKFIWKT